MTNSTEDAYRHIVSESVAFLYPAAPRAAAPLEVAEQRPADRRPCRQRPAELNCRAARRRRRRAAPANSLSSGWSPIGETGAELRRL